MANSSRQLEVDIIIFGGGIAGLWMLARFLEKGYRTVLLESDSIGSGQTRYSQGIIHGGTKYALTGKMSEAAQMVAAMPSRWRDCIAGKGELDLRGVRVLSEFQYLWSTSSLSSRMAGFFASKLMKSRTRALESKDYPELFQNQEFKGQVYQLDEPVLDVASLIESLTKPNRDFILKLDANAYKIKSDPECEVLLENLDLKLKAKKIIFAAGKGNKTLLEKLDRVSPEMQLRPLQMVAVRDNLPEIYAHCLGASSKPRLTINSSKDSHGHTVWYLGGQLAEDGVGLAADVLIQKARQELTTLFPWQDFSSCQWITLQIDRAEVAQQKGHLPDDVFVAEQDNVITTWPTKLALAPVLAERVENLIHESGLEINKDSVEALRKDVTGLPHPAPAPLPWLEEQRWN